MANLQEIEKKMQAEATKAGAGGVFIGSVNFSIRLVYFVSGCQKFA